MEELSLKDKLTNDYSFKNAANEFTVLYSKDAGKGLKMNDDFTMAVANGEAFGSKDAVIDTDKNGDGRLTYPEAFGIDTCLVLTRTENGTWRYDTLLNKYYASYTWGGADNFAWHWGHDPNGVGQQRAYMTVIYPNAQAALDDYDNFVFPNFFDGDVVQTASSTGVSHTMIIHDQFEQTEFYNPDMYLAQHTNNRVEKSLYEMLTIYRNDPNTMFIFHRIK